MNSLTCRVRLGQPLSIPGWLDTAFFDAIVDEIRTASGGHLNLEIDTSQLKSPILGKTDKLGSFDLHRILRELVGSPASPVDTIGIVLGSRYRYGSRVFGIMFDTAFDLDVPSEGSAPLTAGPPREGAAVFLDEIADNRSAGQAQLRQTFYSTVHELGHVFNLGHSTEPCFMCTSLESTSYEPAEFWRFTTTQSAVLSRAEPSEMGIWPGRSRFSEFDNGDGTDVATGRRRVPLVLRIGLAREHFYHFEPVELDVTVSLESRRTKPVRIPDVVDPGYEHFRIWIQEPNGELRRFRSPRVYCFSGANREIAKGAPFHRDISIFGEAGGYAFRRPGVHRLWVELQLPGRAPCLSNVVEFEILAIRSEKAVYAAKLFSSPAVRTVLYHRLDRHRGLGVSALEEWLRHQRREQSAPSVRYALARAFIEKAAYSRKLKSDLLRKAGNLLRRAADDSALGTHQRMTAARMLGTGELAGKRK
jgi:hypothetical protein